MVSHCLAVLTARGPDRILSEGGSQAWRLKPENAQRVQFCVCVQNRQNGSWGGADQQHHHAFMVGRIKGVVPSPENPERYLIEFSEYARINVPNSWSGLRNPVSYKTLGDFGINDPASLEWQPMPARPSTVRLRPHEVQDEDKDGFGPLTIAEAKAGLALGLGVPESAIEIMIRA